MCLPAATTGSPRLLTRQKLVVHPLLKLVFPPLGVAKYNILNFLTGCQLRVNYCKDETSSRNRLIRGGLGHPADERQKVGLKKSIVHGDRERIRKGKLQLRWATADHTRCVVNPPSLLILHIHLSSEKCGFWRSQMCLCSRGGTCCRNQQPEAPR